jgi:hypothetical protein
VIAGWNPIEGMVVVILCFFLYDVGSHIWDKLSTLSVLVQCILRMSK